MEVCQLVVKKTGCDGIGNVLKGFISALSINPNTVIECNPNYMFGLYDTILEDKHIYKGGGGDYVYTCRLLVLKGEEGEQEHIHNEFRGFDGIGNSKFHDFYSRKLIDWNYDSGKISEQVKERVFRIIDTISFKKIVLDHVESVVNKFVDKKVLGVSVRTWKCKHENNINRAYSFDVYKEKINQVLAAHPEINQIILSVDNDSVIGEYLNYFKDRGIDCFVLMKSEGLNEIQNAISKALILSKSDYFIGNRISTFSELVFWFGKHKAQVYTVY